MLSVSETLGFARATNLGIETQRALAADLIATVNDDAVLEPGWLGVLVDFIESRRNACEDETAAVQGLVLQADTRPSPGTSDDPVLIDGAGIGFTRWWQAQQLLRDHPLAAAPSDPRQIFGVSATAALYRRSALEQARTSAGVFDERLDTYYEDVDLACRLRAGGGSAWLVPRARAWHRGSTSGATLGRRRAVLLYSNRWLVLARALGRRFPLSAPRIALRDLVDLAQGRITLPDLTLAWLRAARLLGTFARLGPAQPEVRAIERWSRIPERSTGATA